MNILNIFLHSSHDWASRNNTGHTRQTDCDGVATLPSGSLHVMSNFPLFHARKQNTFVDEFDLTEDLNKLLVAGNHDDCDGEEEDSFRPVSRMQCYSSSSGSCSDSASEDVSSPDTVIGIEAADTDTELPDLAPLLAEDAEAAAACFYSAVSVVCCRVISVAGDNVDDNIDSDAFNDHSKFAQIYEVMNNINVHQMRTSATPFLCRPLSGRLVAGVAVCNLNWF